MPVGPLQFVFLGVRGEEQRSEVAKALRNLSERGAIRVLDIAYTTKQPDGTFAPAQEYTTMTEQERKQLGTAVGALVGMGFGGYYGGREGAKQGARMGAEIGAQGGEGVVTAFAQEEFGESVDEVRDHIRELATDVPVGATCALALIEHKWMLELRDQLQKAGVAILGSGLIRPRSLVMLGAQIAAAQQANIQ
jgi:uncharacterized membrane protein